MNTSVSLRQANALFMDARYEDALRMYEALAARGGELAPMYADNAARARARLAQPVGDAPTPAERVAVHFLQIQELTLPLEQAVDKLCFYIQALQARIDRVQLFLDPALLPAARELRHATLPSLARFAGRLECLDRALFNERARPPQDGLRPILYVFDGSVLSDDSKPFHATIRQFQKTQSAWRIHDSIQHHGSYYLKSVEPFFDPTAARQRLQQRIVQLRTHPHAQRCVVAGTGPSLKYVYSLPELSESIVVTCNSAIYNETLMQSLVPHFVCATDPIFHAGWGKYASEFRAALLKRMRQFDFMLVVPTRDYHVYLDFLPEDLHARVGSYLLDGSRERFNLDLAAEATTKSTGNVLTNSMLPIAASISREISIVGCDGKKQSSGYFWSHDPSSQINQHMADIQKEFKGFFDIDYDKYYADHCETLTRLLAQIEEQSQITRSRTPSYIPALVQRADVPPEVGRTFDQQVDVSIIMPARDAGATIEASCTSVATAAQQAGIRARLVVVDDGSEDDTVEAARRFVHGADGRIVDLVLLQTVGLGVAGARNVGLGYVNSRYVSFLDADDFLSVDALSSRIGTLTAARAGDESVIGAFCRTLMVDTQTGQTLAQINDFKAQGRRYTFRDTHSPAHISSILYVAQAVEAVRFQLGRHYGEDWLFLAQVLAQGGHLVFDKTPHSVYSMNPASATKRNPHLHIAALFDVLHLLYRGREVGDPVRLFAQGLEDIGVRPSYTDKSAELLCRLIGALIASRQFVQGRQHLSELFKRGLCDPGTLKRVEARVDAMAHAVLRELRRFQRGESAEIESTTLRRGLDALRVADLSAALYDRLTRTDLTEA